MPITIIHARVYERRLKGYAAIGYVIEEGTFPVRSSNGSTILSKDRFRCPEFSPSIAQKTMELCALTLANTLGWERIKL